MQSHQAVKLIGQLLRETSHPMIDDVSVDGDHKSAEIIVTTDDGEDKQDWVISSGNITEAARDYDDEPDSDDEPESLTNVKRIFDEFDALESKWSKFGAGDTEPDTEFQYAIVDTLNDGGHNLPSNAREWQLFINMDGVDEAAAELTSKMNEMVAVIKATPANERKALVAWAKDVCWRSNHDLIS